MSRLLRKPLILALFAGAVCGILAWALCQLPVARHFDTALFDLCFVLRGQRASQSRVLIISIDDEALRQLRKPLAFISPELAQVVELLKSRKASAIGLDLIIPDELRDFPGLETALLARAIADHPVVLSQWLDSEPPVLPVLQWQLPLEKDWQLAFTDATVDHDYVLRRQQLMTGRDERAYTHFALALCHAARSNAITIEEGKIRLGKTAVPLDANGCLTINYVGPPGSFRTISLFDALRAARGETSALPADLKDTIVIIGVTSRSQQDYHRTPFSHTTGGRSSDELRLMSGAEVNANIVATMLDRAFIRPVYWPTCLPVMVFVASFLAAILVRRRWWESLVLVVAFHFGWKAIAVMLLKHANLQVGLLPMFLLGPIVYVAVFWVRWQAVRGIMSAVKSAEVAAALETLGSGLDLRGELRRITVFFADVRGFTTFSEAARDDPQRVVSLLNEFFGEAAPIIERHQGFVDKYIGDGIMAIFGAPGERPTHAFQAVRAAIELVEAVHRKKRRWAELGNPEMRIGIGIHTGVAVVGTLGSPNRLDYTAIGDTVNAAARLEGANKDLGTEVLISKQTRDAILAQSGQQALDQLGCSADIESVAAKGRSPIDVYRIPVV